MSPQHTVTEKTLTEAPPIDRKLRLRRTQALGMPLLIAVPLAALALGEATQTIGRVALVYLFLLIGLRLVGKREFSQLSAMELVTLMMIPEIVSQAIQPEGESVIASLVGVSTLLSLVFLTSLIVQRSEQVEQALTGAPSVLLEHGRFREEALNKERVTPGEVTAEIHRAGLETLDQVKWAILEPDGKISIIPEDRFAVNPPRADRAAQL